MSKKTRRVVALLLVLAFFVSAPIVVLHTQGYRYDWRKGKAVKTGILRVETMPSGAEVTLNGRPSGRTTPAIFFRMLPEDYDVRVSLPGRIAWERTLPVRSGETTFASGVWLLPDVLPTLQARVDADEAIFTADAARFAFVRADGDWTEVGVATTTDGTAALLSRADSDTERNVRVSWSPSEMQLLVTAHRGDATVATVFAAATPHEAVTIHDRVPGTIRRARWESDDRLLAFTAAGAYRITLGAVPAATALPGTIGLLDRVALGGSYLSLITRPDSTVLLQGDEELATLPVGTYTFLHAAGRRAAVLDENRGRTHIIDLENGTVLATYMTDHLRLDRAGGDALLLWSDFEIFAVDAVTGHGTLLTRVGTPIRDVRPTGRLPFVAYATDAGITLIEREDIHGRASVDLIQFPSIGGFGIDTAGTRLFFLGAIGNQRGVYVRGL